MSIKWKVDPAHSEVQFKVRHLMISKITGYFKSYDLVVETETEDFNTAKSILFTADVDSINTNNKQRDEHLKSSEFFNATEHAQIKFVGKKYDGNENHGKIYGDITIRGITKAITLDVEFGGIVKDPYGQIKAGFTVTGALNRKDFGLTWDAVTEAGNVVVSDEIKIYIDIELTKQQ